jgi:hypothetical protein
MQAMAYLREFLNGEWTAIVEDDDNVGYAYLLQQGHIVSDVWLYNRGPAPEAPPWKDSDATMPFLNSAEYVTDEGINQDPPPAALSAAWSGEGSDLEVTICIDDRHIAWLRPDARPGWSALVKRNGPLARVRDREG